VKKPKGRTVELELDLAVIRKAKRLQNRSLRELESLEKLTLKRIKGIREAETEAAQPQ
jgi:hypothetical protein